MAQPEIKVMFDSEEAAQLKTVTGWVSKNGRFWGDNERAARWDGSTHQMCECGQIMKKDYTACETCRAAKQVVRYNAMPKKEWDGVGFLYSDAADKYFTDEYEALDFLEGEKESGDGEEPHTLESLRLIICEPNKVRPMDYDDWCDELPEDGEPPDWLVEAVKAFNEAAKSQEPLSWSPGKFALLISNESAPPQESEEADKGGKSDGNP